MSSCENTLDIYNKGLNVNKNDIFVSTYDQKFNTRIPNIFRQCYINQVNLRFPDICPLILDSDNNISTFKFRSPKVISNDNIKSIFYYGINSTKNENLNNKINIDLINNSLNLLKIDKINLNHFRYYLLNRYNTNSLLYQYLILTGTIFQNYNYNINNKINCNYIINWEYTYGCYLDGNIVKNFENYWNTNDLLILHYYYTTMLNNGLDSYNITSTNMYEFMRVIYNFLIVMKDLTKEYNFKINKLCYCAPEYYFQNNTITTLYNTYIINSDENILTNINEEFLKLNIYTYEINIPHFLTYNPSTNSIDNSKSIDGSINYTISGINVIQSNLYQYFYDRKSNTQNLGQLSYQLENNSGTQSEFPLFYYDNEISQNNGNKYIYNEKLSIQSINGNIQFYSKNNININQQYVFNDYYYTSILVIIDKQKFGDILPTQDIINTTTFGQSLIGNFETLYNQGVIKIKSNNDYKTFSLTENDLIYENNIIFVFVIKNNNILSINSLDSNNQSNIINIQENYNIDFYQTDTNLSFTNKKLVDIYNYQSQESILNLFQYYTNNQTPFNMSQNTLNKFTINYNIQRFTNINEINYNYNIGYNINYTLKINLFNYSKFKPDYINILYYDNYTKQVYPIFEPSSLIPPSIPIAYNIYPTFINNEYYFYFDNNYIFPWYDILIIIYSSQI
jgi:hypothetical protein